MTSRRKRPRLKIFAKYEMLIPAFPGPQPHSKDIPIYNGRGCTLLELSERKCRWPISNPGADDFCFCGNERSMGCPIAWAMRASPMRLAGIAAAGQVAITRPPPPQARRRAA
jgi:hypothetical protein